MESLSTDQLKSAITAPGWLVLDVYTPRCSACPAVIQILSDLSPELPGIRFAKYDAASDMDMAVELDISAVPTVIIFNSGTRIGHKTGAVSKEKYRQWITDHVAADDAL